MTIVGNLLKKINEDIWHSDIIPNDVDSDPEHDVAGGIHDTATGGLDFRAKGTVLPPPGVDDIWKLSIAPPDPDDVGRGSTMDNTADRGAMTQSGPGGAMDVIESLDSAYQAGMRIGS